MAEEQKQTAPCPNCGTLWSSGASVCPHCGYMYSPLAAWPPSITGVTPILLPDAAQTVTGKAWGDVTLGLALSLLSILLACIGLIVMPILYFTLKAKYPYFARGLGFGTLAGLIVMVVGVIALAAGLLGALSTCKFPS